MAQTNEGLGCKWSMEVSAVCVRNNTIACRIMFRHELVTVILANFADAMKQYSAWL